jgi:hypothetical protein
MAGGTDLSFCSHGVCRRTLVALSSSDLPARRMVRVDPITARRSD